MVPSITRGTQPPTASLAAIMKVFRDWQISGDTAWLKRMYPLAKRSIDYCIATWDPDHRGALFEPHHNTYDIEFWGPDGMCTSIYLGALSAMAQMATAVGESADATLYGDLAQRSAKFMDETLFNGDYLPAEGRVSGSPRQVVRAIHRAGRMTKAARCSNCSSAKDRNINMARAACPMALSAHGWRASTASRLRSREKNVRSTLQAIFRNNFKTDLSQHANAQRPGYAMGHEPGLLLCSWPRGDKPTLPFVYSDEVWTGIEYQVASHLIHEGFVDEGLTIVKALRSRYDGRTRNPWNEYECGNWYARAMSSFALLGALSGFRYSAVDKTLHFGPKLKVHPFMSFFSTASGFGTIAFEGHTVTVNLIEGELAIEKLRFTDAEGTRALDWKITAKPGLPTVRAI